MINAWIEKILDRGAYFVLMLTVAFLPIVVDGKVAENYILPKQLLLVILITVAVLFLIGKLIIEKKITIYRSVLEKPLLLWVVLLACASAFSMSPLSSVLGRSDYFIFNGVLVVALVVGTWLVGQLVDSSSRWRLLVDVLSGSTAVVTSLFLAKTLFNVTILGGNLTATLNTVEGGNVNFGLWLVVSFLLSAGQLINKNVPAGRLFIHFFVVVVSFIALMVLGFTALWWSLVGGIVLLLIVGINFLKASRQGWLVTLFGIMLLVINFIMFGTPQALQKPVPAEVALGFSPSWVVTTKTALGSVRHFLIGTGPGTFAVDFSAYRDATFNYDATAAGLRFNYPQSSLLSFIIELGVPATALFIFIVLYVLGYLIGNVRHVRAALAAEAAGEQNSFLTENILGNPLVAFETILVAVPWLVLTGCFTVFFLTTAVWWLWWLLLGLVLSGLTLFNPSSIRRYTVTFDEKPEQSLSYSFALVLVVSVVIIFGVWYGRLYIAEKLYAGALRSSDNTQAEMKLKEALVYRANYDTYHAALAQVYLKEAVVESQQPKPNVQLIGEKMSLAVNEARRATEISPNSVMLWENLASMYENAAVLVPEARAVAIKSLESAIKLEPTNAFLIMRLGNNYGLSGKWPEAIKEYQAAIDLKKDYVAAYAALANAYEQNKEFDKAVSAFEIIANAATDNAEILYNYGRLVYNRNNKNDRSRAEQLWLQVLDIQPNHSNALYSLGLLNELRGNKSKALEYYYKVKELNPNNKDIVKKINSLVGNK